MIISSTAAAVLNLLMCLATPWLLPDNFSQLEKHKLLYLSFCFTQLLCINFITDAPTSLCCIKFHGKLGTSIKHVKFPIPLKAHPIQEKQKNIILQLLASFSFIINMTKPKSSSSSNAPFMLQLIQEPSNKSLTCLKKVVKDIHPAEQVHLPQELPFRDNRSRTQH